MRLADGRVPGAGDVLWVDFGAPVGHEQAGRRPGLVISPRHYNERSSVLIACPITRQEGQWPWRLAIPAVGRITGFVLLDQIRDVDPTVRHCRFAGRLPSETMEAVRERLVALLATEE